MPPSAYFRYFSNRLQPFATFITLFVVKQQEMPENLREKCHEFVNLLEQTSKKANELKIKILDS